jgi:integrase
MTKLTKSFIDSRPLPEDKPKTYWDDLKGFGLRVSPQGRKTFIVFSRLRGRNVTITIGTFGTFTVEQARDEAGEHLRNLKRGIDPRDLRKADEAVRVTLRTVADEYMARPGKLKQSSKDEIERHVTTTFEAWLHKPIASITEDDCRRRYREMLTRGLRGKGPAPGQANQGFSVLKALINYATRNYRKTDGTPIIRHNPTTALRDDWVTLPERKTRIPESKIGAVWNLLKSARETAYNPQELSSVDVVIMLILTGARLRELTALTWDRVNLDEAWWHLPDPKNRNPVWMPLSTQAVQLLEQRPRTKGSNFVFASPCSESGHIEDPRVLMDKVSDVAGLRLTPHDLRRTFTTFGVTECGVDLYKIELLTNHKPRTVTMKHYMETSHLQYLKPDVQKIGDWIERKALIAAAQASGANVVALRA